ncbi:hypothetical protein Bca101_022610 [Brassica carinata]
MALIYEYMANGNFQEYLSSEKTENLSWEKRLHIAIDSAQEYYDGILSFVDKDQLEPGCSVLIHNKVLFVVGILQDEVYPIVFCDES